MKPKQRPGILAAMKQYLADAAPGGILNPEVTPQGILDTAALATAPVPGLGDILGLTADVNRYRTDPKSRTLGNLGLTGIGLLPLIPNLTVWHGSPHRFAPTKANPLGEFSPEKIGTGEGAQAFGYGHYVAERPGVAMSYRDALGNRQPVNKPLGQMTNVENWANTLVQGADNKADAMRQFDELAKNFLPGQMPKGFSSIAEFKNAVSKKLDELWVGYLYRADLADEAIPRMLDWDKPLSEQKEVLNLIGIDDKHLRQIKLIGGGDSVKGLLNYVESALAVKRGAGGIGNDDVANAARYLAGKGIPGIRYLDQGSRAAGDGTRNFVVFPGNEGILKILERQ